MVYPSFQAISRGPWNPATPVQPIYFFQNGCGVRSLYDWKKSLENVQMQGLKKQILAVAVFKTKIIPKPFGGGCYYVETSRLKSFDVWKEITQNHKTIWVFPKIGVPPNHQF